MSTKVRAVKESPLYQGADEKIAYVLDTTNWGGYTSGAACVLKDQNGKNISATGLSGSVSVSSNEITSPLVQSLEAGKRYRLEFLWVYSGNTFESFLILKGEE